MDPPDVPVNDQAPEAVAILARLVTALGDRYDVESPLGEGGMAFVYLARDIKHDRQVAIKVLKPELAASLGAERFLREIQLTAKLQHPHILPLYDSGDADGLLYYVMPFVVGESLNDYLEREKQLSIEEAIQITREVSEALGQAHTLGMVHRDIKPDNVMMSGGHAIVADFGIARAVTEAGGEKLTQTGMAIGTPAYMSPEQIGGDQEIDGRSDLYSVGCMLYEMLVGQIPFTGPTAMAIMARHTMDQITPPSIMRQSVPAEVEDVVFKAMEKVPADRFRTAHEMIEALRAIERGEVSGQRASIAARSSRMGLRASQMVGRMTGVQEAVPARRWPLVAGIAGAVVVVGAVAAWLITRGGPAVAAGGGLDPRRIAVLYFEDLSSGGELGYVADGLTEGLIDELSSIRDFDIISRNGVAQFRGAEVSRDSTARALEAGTVIVGSVERERDQLRVTTQLIEGESGASFDRATFALPADSLLAILDSVTKDVSQLLRGRLGEEVRTRELRAGTASTEAWALTQRGERLQKEALAFWEADESGQSAAAFDRADSVFALAEAADRQWTEPIVLRAELTRLRITTAHSEDEADQWAVVGIGHAERALALEPENPRALAIRGALRYAVWYYGPDPEPAETERLLTGAQTDLEAATAADESLASAHEILSLVLYFRDDFVSSNLAALRALEADAYLRNADRIMFRLFQTSYDIENFAEARRWCEEAGARFPGDPRFVQCRLWMQTTRAVTPDPDSAWLHLARLEDVTPAAQWPLWKLRGQMLVAGSLARAGLADSARSLLVASRGDIDVDPTRSLLTTEAFIRTLLGDEDDALRLLQTYMVSNPHHRREETETVHWWWRGLQDDPRYQALMRPSS
jgi:serine/threonine-protein kinase